MKKEVLYISGKITDETKRKEAQNLERFIDKGVELTDQGYSVIIPENYHRIGEKANWTWRQFMRHDLILLDKADGIYMMQGWKESRGARIEHRYAKLKKKAIIYEDFKDEGSINNRD